MIRSTPSSSGSGNITPASTTIVVSPHVSASMFMPNSPSPPSATTSSISEGSRATLDGDTPGGESFRSKGAASCGSVRLLGAPETKWGGLNDLRRNYSTAPSIGTREPGVTGSDRGQTGVRPRSDPYRRVPRALQRAGQTREFGDAQCLRPTAAVEVRGREDAGDRCACQRLVREQGVRERLAPTREDRLHDCREHDRIGHRRIRCMKAETYERRPHVRRRPKGA